MGPGNMGTVWNSLGHADGVGLRGSVFRAIAFALNLTEVRV